MIELGPASATGPATDTSPGTLLAPGGVPTTGPFLNFIVLRRRERMFCKNMSFGVGESTTSGGQAPLQIPAKQNRCAFYLHGRLSFSGRPRGYQARGAQWGHPGTVVEHPGEHPGSIPGSIPGGSPGEARLGSARLGLGSSRLGWARLGPSRPGSARLGSARLGSEFFLTLCTPSPVTNQTPVTLVTFSGAQPGTQG